MLAVVKALRMWAGYREGQHLVLVTNHKPLANFDSLPSLSRVQTRWLHELQPYDSTWQYRPDCINAADLLSR